MANPVQDLAICVHARLSKLGHRTPSFEVVRELLDIAYLASLKTEEGAFVKGSLTYANSSTPQVVPPTRRASYPQFHKFRRPLPLTVESVVKLARAVDRWSASIAVSANNAQRLKAWGVVDQLTRTSMGLMREGDGGFGHPGIMTVLMDGVGKLSVYHNNFFLCAIDGQALVTNENDVLDSPLVWNRLVPYLKPLAEAVVRCAKRKGEGGELLKLQRKWTQTLSRLCIGLRRIGTGGAFLISPAPVEKQLSVAYQFEYSRMAESLILGVVDEQYRARIDDELRDARRSETVSSQLCRDAMLADAETEDRESELGAAIKLVTSLASVDGLVLFDPLLRVRGFGVKITATSNIGVVYDGMEFSTKGKSARRVDLSHFGTRHTSMLRYCRADRNAIGILISQDGHIRIVISIGAALTFWDRVKVLGHSNYSDSAAETHVKHERELRRKRRAMRRRLGYTDMPKSVDALLMTK